MVHQISCLLLLNCLAGIYGNENEQGRTTVDTTSVQMLPTDGPSSVVIRGVDVVTLGILYGFQCSASCYPACNFTWTWGNVTSQGPELSLKLTQLQAAQNLTCTAVNPVTGRSVTAHKTLQVAAGPSNIQISGPEFLFAGVTSNFTCSADCYPSCTYTWSLVSESIALGSFQGNSLSITLLPGMLSTSLTCKAQDTLSHLYISTTLPLWVPDGPSSVVIRGADVVTLGILYGFQCSASCYPACNFTWTWGNVTSQGPELSLKLTQLQAAQNLTCTAVNPVTGRSVTAHKTLQVTAGPSNIQISGPEILLTGIASNFTCSADCYPSCTYTWIIISESIAFSIVHGNSVSIIPLPSTLTASLTCKAQDTHTDLYISTTLPLWVALPDGSPTTHPKETSAVLLLAFIIYAALTL